MRKALGRRFWTVVVVVALVAAPSAAFSTEHDEPTEPDRFGVEVDAYFDEVLSILLFGINDVDADVPVECSVPDGVVVERTEDPDTGEIGVAVVEGDWSLPESCTAVDVLGPSGQVNHGQVVSSFVHALKAIDRTALGVPFGQLVRQIAGSEFGKQDKDAVADEADETEGDDASGPPPHANNDKDKKPKSNGGNNGNGRGPGK